jgi:NADH dehydrogenase
MTYRNILLIGGSGFVGRHLAAQLAARMGRNILVPSRRYERVRDLLLLPTVTIFEADPNDAAALERLLPGVDAVINLAGILHGRRGAAGTRYGPAFAQAHVELPQRLVAACAEHGISRYLHMSALGAARDAPSMYLRSKADGELAAQDNPAVATTIFRPSVIFGPEDHFMNRFAALQRWLPFVPLAAAGARLQPVYVEDVAQAFIAALEDDLTIGKTYELAGPKAYTLRELVQFAGIWSGHPRPLLELPPALARLQAWLFELMPGTPLVSRDNLDSMKVDSVAAGPVAPILGIEPVALEAVVPYYLNGRLPHEGYGNFRRQTAQPPLGAQRQYPRLPG